MWEGVLLFYVTLSIQCCMSALCVNKWKDWEQRSPSPWQQIAFGGIQVQSLRQKMDMNPSIPQCAPLLPEQGFGWLLFPGFEGWSLCPNRKNQLREEGSLLLTVMVLIPGQRWQQSSGREEKIAWKLAFSIVIPRGMGRVWEVQKATDGSKPQCYILNTCHLKINL